VAPGSGLRFLLLGALIAALAACSSGSSATSLPIPSGAVVVRVVNAVFQPAAVTAPSNQGFTLYFDNADSAPHNIAFLGADGNPAFKGDIFSGVAQKVYQVPALASGTYKLHCDVHPEMSGTLTVP